MRLRRPGFPALLKAFSILPCQIIRIPHFSVFKSTQTGIRLLPPAGNSPGRTPLEPACIICSRTKGPPPTQKPRLKIRAFNHLTFNRNKTSSRHHAMFAPLFSQRVRVNVNVVPAPSWLRTSIFSPMSCSTSLQIDSPRPVPLPVCALSAL